jgi:flagellar basal-body rod modification protein FlgD
MSAVDFLGGSSNPGSSTGPNAFNSLTSGQFLQIIFTELANQDPLEPNDTQAMIDQLSSIRAIESDTQMVQSLERLVSQSELASASQLIGSLVSGITLDNRRVADLVVSVSQTADGPVLNLFDGSRMFFRFVDEIVGPLNDPGIDPDPDTDPDPDIDPDADPDNDSVGLNPPDVGGTADADGLSTSGADSSSQDQPVEIRESPGG